MVTVRDPDGGWSRRPVRRFIRLLLLLVLVTVPVACDPANPPAPPTGSGVRHTPALASTPDRDGTPPELRPGLTPGPTTTHRSGETPLETTIVPAAGAAATLVALPLTEPVIDPDRSRVPRGKLRVAFPVDLDPHWLDSNWLDPQTVSDSFLSYALFLDHLFDPMIGATPEGRFTYLLADRFEMTSDFRRATLRLREGVKFHNGEPVTAGDVKFTYENYSGVNAALLHDRTERVQVVDQRTVTFHFKEPFVDFLRWYGSHASGAGYVVPRDYYQRVGPAGFRLAPLGTGAYRVWGLSEEPEVVLEAFPDYWRKVPHIRGIVVRGMPEAVGRVTALRTGEVDVAYLITSDLLPATLADPNLQVAPNPTAAFWLFFPGLEDPDNPFSHQAVREAVSLALDREALARAETHGLGLPTGNFIPPGKPGRTERPVPESDLARARELLAEAGFAEGFQLDAFVPSPPAYSLGELILESLGELGIGGELRITEGRDFRAMLERHRAGFPEVQLAFGASLEPPDAASYFRAFARCQQGFSVNCDPHIDDLLARHDASRDLTERARLVAELQSYVLDSFIFVPIYLDPFPVGAGPRLKGNLKDHTRVHPYLFPYEDLELNP